MGFVYPYVNMPITLIIKDYVHEAGDTSKHPTRVLLSFIHVFSKGALHPKTSLMKSAGFSLRLFDSEKSSLRQPRLLLAFLCTSMSPSVQTVSHIAVIPRPLCDLQLNLMSRCKHGMYRPNLYFQTELV